MPKYKDICPDRMTGATGARQRPDCTHHMKEKIAVIDMGTNTFHLLIAETDAPDFTLLVDDRLPVRIGAEGMEKGIITKAGMGRAIAAMETFRARCDQLGVGRILAFGTSALRNATNRQVVLSAVGQATGISPVIISGDEEAELIYAGVNLALQLGDQCSLIVDIGGGSVEFIIGDGREIFWKQSVDIGAQRLLEKFKPHDPIWSTERDALHAYFRETLPLLRQALTNYRPTLLAGSSGTFDTLSDIYCYQQGIPTIRQPETPFDIGAFEKIFTDLISKNRSQRLAIPGMIELRVDMIVVASILIDFLLHEFSFTQMRVSSFSLKEGVLATVIHRTEL